MDALIEVTDVEALFRELSGRGARFHQELASQPWGTRDFVLLDPDGHLLCFMQESADA